MPQAQIPSSAAYSGTLSAYYILPKNQHITHKFQPHNSHKPSISTALSSFFLEQKMKPLT